jgi:hypothetical protein
MKIPKKFLNLNGDIIRHYELFIPKAGGKIKELYYESPVLISNHKEVIISNDYGSFVKLVIRKTRHDDKSSSIGYVHSYVRNWGNSLLEYNGLVGAIYSFQSEKVCRRRVVNDLKKLIEREYGAYGIMLDTLNEFIRNK